MHDLNEHGLMIVCALLVALQAVPTEEDVFAATRKAQQEAQQPVTPLTDQEWQSYIESMSKTPDADALFLDKNGQMRQIFSKYFTCYRKVLDGNPNLNLSDSNATSIAFRHAYDACATDRSEAQEEADRFAATLSEFTDISRRKRAIDFYRSWQGGNMLKDYFEQRSEQAEPKGDSRSP